MEERIQKVLSRVGLASRRQVDRWLQEGRLRINQRQAKPGDRMGPHDRVYLDNRLLKIRVQQDPVPRVLLLNKPTGTICSRKDPEHQSSVYRLLPKIRSQRWVMVGRLDLNTSGLLLFTNHGELAHRLMHPSSNLRRGYQVRVFGEPDDAVLERLATGVELEDGMARFDKIIPIQKEHGRNQWFYVEVSQGRHRMVRRLWGSQDIQVSRLIRVQYGPLSFSRHIPPGRYEELSPGQVNALLRQMKLA
ncbi:MAG: rRNA pseudouridine synthase [Gammaproteobacteria bacterium]|nr:MAG: rRNA pseudouridine synthase [Gammaproteobacteria bacterium]